MAFPTGFWLTEQPEGPRPSVLSAEGTLQESLEVPEPRPYACTEESLEVPEPRPYACTEESLEVPEPRPYACMEESLEVPEPKSYAHREDPSPGDTYLQL